jgi:hypothetical protein
MPESGLVREGEMLLDNTPRLTTLHHPAAVAFLDSEAAGKGTSQRLHAVQHFDPADDREALRRANSSRPHTSDWIGSGLP